MPYQATFQQRFRGWLPPVPIARAWSPRSNCWRPLAVQQPSIDEVIELVTTGPEAGTVTNRDTQVVVQELFRNAERSVLVAGYELYQAEPVFRTLADRMADQPRPVVRMFLNVKRPFGETSTDSELIASFAYRFRTEHWPTDRPLPEIYFDPRSLTMDAKRKAVLHAKCVVIDGRTAFVSSANFTEAAQERNIEVGVLVRSEIVAERIINFFAALISTGAVRRGIVRKGNHHYKIPEVGQPDVGAFKT